MKKLALLCVLSLSALCAHDRIYISDEDIDVSHGPFMMHIGHNVWIETDAVHRDHTGLYTFESSLPRCKNAEYVKSWKCPYCYRYWPIGTACQNDECPSKYK